MRYLTGPVGRSSSVLKGLSEKSGARFPLPGHGGAKPHEQLDVPQCSEAGLVEEGYRFLIPGDWFDAEIQYSQAFGHLNRVIDKRLPDSFVAMS